MHNLIPPVCTSATSSVLLHEIEHFLYILLRGKCWKPIRSCIICRHIPISDIFLSSKHMRPLPRILNRIRAIVTYHYFISFGSTFGRNDDDTIGSSRTVDGYG